MNYLMSICNNLHFLSGVIFIIAICVFAICGIIYAMCADEHDYEKMVKAMQTSIKYSIIVSCISAFCFCFFPNINI